jgi:ComF family protein
MSILSDATEIILDTLFPITCLSCGKEHIWLCENCLQKIIPLSFQQCPLCEKQITSDGILCSKCKPLSALDGLLVATHYRENGIDRLIHFYKYKFIQDLSFPLGKIATRTFSRSTLPLPDLILPVPLHSKRLRWRGFNQSQLLAEYIGKNLTAGFEIPVPDTLLIRKKHTSPQMKIKTYQQRLSNLHNAFAIDPEKRSSIQGKTILLVDDVATTGATLFECAKVLKQNGAKKVFAIVLARQTIE